MELFGAVITLERVAHSNNKRKIEGGAMRRELVRELVVSVAIVLAGISGCRSQSSGPDGTDRTPTNIPPNTVVMSAMSFTPSTMTVARGTAITWRNDDSAVHTSTSDSTGWDTGDMAAGAARTITFNTAGTFRYHCTYHRSMGMVATLTVQ